MLSHPQAGVSRHCLGWTEFIVIRRQGKNNRFLLCFANPNFMLNEWYKKDLKLLSYTFRCPLSDDTEFVYAFLRQPCLNGWFVASIDKIREISVLSREFYENRTTLYYSNLNLVEETVLFRMVSERARSVYFWQKCGQAARCPNR